MWEIKDQFIRSGHGDASKAERCATTDFNGKLPDGIKAIYCKERDADQWFIQSYLFPRSKFTLTSAKKWFDANHADTTEHAELFLKEMQTFEVKDKEIFKAGVWKGYTFTIADLDAIVASFQEVAGSRGGAQLKLGHDDGQALLQNDGYPAAGWVKSVRRVGDKILADLTAVPRLVKQFIEKGAYKNISAELIRNYTDPITKKVFPCILKAVSILGADAPAVKGLSDLWQFYAESDADLSGDADKVFFSMKSGAVVAFAEQFAEWDTEFINNLPDSAFACIKSGGSKDEDGKTKPRSLRVLPYKGSDGKVDLAHLRNALARLDQTDLSSEQKASARRVLVAAAKAAGIGEYKEMERKMDLEKKVEELTQSVAKLSEDLTKKDAEIAGLKKEKTDLEASVAKHSEETRTAEIVAFVEAKVKEGKILPANKDKVVATMKAIDAGQTVELKEGEKTVKMSSLDAYKSFISSMPNIVKFEEQSEAAEAAKNKGVQTFKEVDENNNKTTKASLELHSFAESIQKRAGNEKMTYREALRLASKEKPELAEAPEGVFTGKAAGAEE